MGNGRERGWAVTVISFSGIHLFFSLFVSSFSFLESSVIDLWELNFSFLAFYTYYFSCYHFLRLDGDFSNLPKSMNKMKSRFLHSTLFFLFHNGLIFLLLSEFLSMT